MKASTVGNWLQIGANVGILLGLILVLLQMNQSADLTRHQIFNDRMSDWLDAQVARMGENPAEVFARVVESPEELSYEDFLVLDAVLSRYLDAQLRIKVLKERGLYAAEDESWRKHFDWAAEGKASPFTLYFGNPVSRAWWKETGFWWDEEYDSAVNEAFASTSDEDSMQMYRAVQRSLAE